MRELLESLDLESDLCSHQEFRKEAQKICSCYVGGNWEEISPDQLEIKRIT